MALAAAATITAGSLWTLSLLGGRPVASPIGPSNRRILALAPDDPPAEVAQSRATAEGLGSESSHPPRRADFPPLPPLPSHLTSASTIRDDVALPTFELPTVRARATNPSSVSAPPTPAPGNSNPSTAPSAAAAQLFTGATDGPRDARSVDRPPRGRRTPPPEYPESARRAGLEGSVRVRVWISEDGRVTRCEVLEAEGPASLRRAVERTVPSWIYEPAHHAGSAVPVVATATIEFRIPR